MRIHAVKQVLLTSMIGALTITFLINLLQGQNNARETVIRAEKFVLVDKVGKERGRFEIAEDGSVGLTLLDNKGSSRIKLVLTDDQLSKFDLIDEHGKKRISAQAGSDSSNLIFYSKNDVCLLRIGLDNKGSPGVACYDNESKIRGLFGMSDNAPSLYLFDDLERSCGGFIVDASGHGILSINDGEHKNGVVAYLSSDGSPGLKFLDLGKPRLLVGSTHDGPSGVFVLDENKKEKVQLFYENDGKGGLVVTGRNEERLEFGIWPNEAIGLSIKSENVLMAELVVEKNKTTQFNLTNNSKRYKFRLKLPSNIKPELKITEDDDKTLFEAYK